MNDVDSSWLAICEWLQSSAPVSFATLRPGLDDAGLASLRQQLNLQVPEPLAQLLRHNDGAVRYVFDSLVLPMGFYLMPAAEIIEDAHRIQTSYLPDDDEDFWFGYLHHPGWIRFAADTCGDYFVYDTRPDPPHGEVFRLDKTDGPNGMSWPSLAAMLDDTLNMIHGGLPRFMQQIPHDMPHPELLLASLKTFVRDGVLRWGSPSDHSGVR